MFVKILLSFFPLQSIQVYRLFIFFCLKFQIRSLGFRNIQFFNNSYWILFNVGSHDVIIRQQSNFRHDACVNCITSVGPPGTAIYVWFAFSFLSCFQFWSQLYQIMAKQEQVLIIEPQNELKFRGKFENINNHWLFNVCVKMKRWLFIFVFLKVHLTCASILSLLGLVMGVLSDIIFAFEVINLIALIW